MEGYPHHGSPCVVHEFANGGAAVLEIQYAVLEHEGMLCGNGRGIVDVAAPPWARVYENACPLVYMLDRSLCT